MTLRLAVVAILSVLVLGGSEAGANVVPDARGAAGLFEHGGGCRKNSPPGRCCHMDHSTGVVHCH